MTRREAIRCIKRYIAREVYQLRGFANGLRKDFDAVKAGLRRETAHGTLRAGRERAGAAGGYPILSSLAAVAPRTCSRCSVVSPFTESR
jgi:hypothetical protein